MKNNKLNRNVNKVITLTMAGAVALSAPLSFVYASPDADEQHEYTDIHGVCDICGETKEDGNHFVDEIIDDGIIEIDPNDTENDKKDDDVIIVDTCDEDHIEYPFVDLDNDGFCDNCGAEKKENTENTESTEIPEEKKDFTFFIKGYNTADDKNITNIYNKLKTDGKYKLSYSDNKTEKDLKVKVNIYNNNDEIIDNFVLSNSDNIIKNLLDEDEQGYKQFSCKYELVAENLHYTKDNKCFMYSSIKTENGEIPVLKLFQLTPCTNHSDFENPVHIEKEFGVVCDYNNPNFDLDLFLEDEEIENFFFGNIVVDKDCCCVSGVPDLPDLPDISTETTETTESTETESTETESSETESTETESTETESTETESSETESSETESTETESSETESSETESTETESSETESTETESSETESTETESTETESTETESTETESSETESSETRTTETTTTPTPEPVKPVNPVEPVKPVEPTPTPITTTTETTTTTTETGKVDPSEKNEIVQTGDLATNTYYGGYFLTGGFAVLTAFFKKFKK